MVSPTSSSFYTDGEQVIEGEVVNNDYTAPNVPSQAPSSLYPNGGDYNALANVDEVMTEFNAALADAHTTAAASATSATASQVSANASQVSAVAADASNVSSGTHATNAAASEAAAAASATAAATSATNAATSATNAATSASTATTQAGTATTEAGIATTQAGNAATSASQALTSKNNAATSETNAATSATNAASSASAAATSATNAATAVQAAAGTATPLIDGGTGTVGTGTKWAHEDHKHPADTVTADARIANAAGTATPLANGTAAVGTGTKWAHEDHVHPTDTSRAPTANPTFTGTVTVPTATVGDNSTKAASTAFVLANAGSVSPSNFRGFIDGCGLAWVSTTSFTVKAGVVVDSTNANFMALASAVTKTTSAWAVGTAAGGLDTGSIAANTWYHVYVIKRLDTLVVDAIYSTSASAPTLPTNYTVDRRIGSVKTNGSSQFIKFFQDGDTFTWDVAPLDIQAINPGTAAVSRTLSTPLGVRVEAHLITGFGLTATTDNPAGVLLSDLSLTDTAPILGATSTGGMCVGTYQAVNNFQVQVRCFTNTSSQVRSRLQLSTAGTTLFISTLGWVDARGRNS